MKMSSSTMGKLVPSKDEAQWGKGLMCALQTQKKG